MSFRHLIVFDMDGVLIDVSRSYRDTVRTACRLFLKGARHWGQLPDPLFPAADLAAVKQGGGLNNDWDLTCHVLDLLFSMMASPCRACPKSTPATHRAIIRQCDAAPLVAFLGQTASPLSRLQQIHSGRGVHAFIESSYRGDVGSGNMIKQIFQEVYLGRDLFRQTYGFEASFHTAEGYVGRESPLIDAALLKRLADPHFLAIATGRPRAEAEHALQRFGLTQFFRAMYTLDECKSEEKRLFESEGRTVCLSKPDPFMLDAIASAAMESLEGELFCLGDMPDDMVAAGRSAFPYHPVGVTVSTPDKKNLRRDLRAAGAEAVLEDFDQLERLIQAHDRRRAP